MTTQDWYITGGDNPGQPRRLDITGPSIVIGREYRLRRHVGNVYEPVAGPNVATEYTTLVDVLIVFDYLYPLDRIYTYELLDSTGATLLDVSPPIPATSSEGTPWVRDTVYPSTRISAMTIVDVTGRIRAGRVNVFTQIAQQYPVTIGDVRSSSAGTITALCRSHAERDQLIRALSSGSPCQLRVPASCGHVVDEMYFTPTDIDESRLGKAGACLLTIDFVEVQYTELASFMAIAYAVQTANAAAAAMNYNGLRSAFTYLDYAAMTNSPSGIAP